jgi:lipoate-protein ligase A
MKVIGSAQRKRHGAIVQHGSILLRTSGYVPTLPGIAELAGASLDATTLAREITEAITEVERWHFTERDWTAAERNRISEIAAETYANVEWTEKR